LVRFFLRLCGGKTIVEGIDKSKSKEKEEQDVHNEIRRSHFSYQMVIGKGGFGKVWICEHRQSKKY